MHIKIEDLSEGDTIEFTSDANAPCFLYAEHIASLSVGMYIYNSGGEKCFLVLGKSIYATQSIMGISAVQCVILSDMPSGTQEYYTKYEGYSIAWITLSDKGSTGQRTDTSGPLIGTVLRGAISISLERGFVIPDDPERLEHLLIDLTLHQRFNCILTTGGTGLSERDNTPKVMERVLHSFLPGFQLAMMQASMKHVATAIISRATAGIIGKSIVINLPGSPKAVEQNLAPLLPALQHAMEKLRGDTGDCANLFRIEKKG